MQRKYQWTDRKPGTEQRQRTKKSMTDRAAEDRYDRDDREHVLDNGIASVEQYTR